MMEHLELIEKYLENNLSEEERTQFLLLQKTDPKFVEQLNLSQSVEDELSNQETQKSLTSILEAESTYFNRKKAPTQRIQLQNFFKYAAVLFVFCLLSCLAYNFLKPVDLEKTYFAYYEPYDIGLNLRSTEVQKNSTIQEALTLYQNGNYQEALTAFNTLNGQMDIGANNFYRGMCHLELGAVDSAIETFKQVITENDVNFRMQANWYLALSYLKTNQKELARPLFLQLSQTRGKYQKNSQKILDKL